MRTDTMLIGKFKLEHKDKSKTPLGAKLLYLGMIALTSWVIYNAYQIYTIHKLARVFYDAFPALGR